MPRKRPAEAAAYLFDDLFEDRGPALPPDPAFEEPPADERPDPAAPPPPRLPQPPAPALAEESPGLAPVSDAPAPPAASGMAEPALQDSRAHLGDGEGAAQEAGAGTGETNDLRGGLTWRVTHDPYRDKEPRPEPEAFALFGRNLFGDEVLPPASGPLSAKFTLPPFTVLDARQGIWQDRKRAWLALGIQSEVGRGENLLRFSDTALEPDPVKRAAMQEARAARTFGQDFELGAQASHGGEGKAWPKGERPPAATAVSQRLAPGGGGGGAWLGGPHTASSAKFGRLSGGHDDIFSDGPRSASAGARQTAPGGGETGTSIFDPVLTELLYRWFAPAGGFILDPFAGGSVRGIVASKLKAQYVGVELRPEQLAANLAQAAAICAGDPLQPAWIEGDACDVQGLVEGCAFDFLLACPPYGDLEQYSDDPRDLSNMPWDKFAEAYGKIIRAALACLRPDRFACYVVGDIRDEAGFYRRLPEMTVACFEAAGARKYNEAILVTAVGSLPVRVGRQFDAGRKLGKTHQNVLIFCKGDPKRAAEACNGQLDLPA